MAIIEPNTNKDWAGRGVTDETLAQFKGKPRQTVINVDDGFRPVVMDGVTIGGKFKSASLDELNQAKEELAQNASDISEQLASTTESLNQKISEVKTTADAALPKVGGTVSGNLTVSGSTSTGSLTSGAVNSTGGVTTTTLKATGTSTLATVNASSVTTSGTLTANGAAALKKTLTVTGATTLSGGASTTSLQVTGTSATVGGKNIARSVNNIVATADGNVVLPNFEQDGVKPLGGVDYNTVTSPGFYHCNGTGSTNGPGFASKLIVLTTNTEDPKLITQLAFPIDNDKNICPAIRYTTQSGVWKAWEKFALTQSSENILAGPVLTLKDSRVTKGTTPSAARFSQLWFGDVNSKLGSTTTTANILGAVENAVRTDGSSDIKIYSNRNTADTDERAQIIIGWRKNGSGEFVPTTVLPNTVRINSYKNNVTYDAIRIEPSSVDGQDDVIISGANQTVFICSGETGWDSDKARTFRNSIRIDDEDVVLASDNNLVFAVNCNTQSETDVKRAYITSNGNFYFPGRLFPDVEHGAWQVAPYVLRQGNVSRNTIPGSTQYLYIPFYGKDGVANATDRLANIEYAKNASGDAIFQFAVNNPSVTASESAMAIRMRWRKDGEEYVPEIYTSHHPHDESNDYSIATTKWVNTKITANNSKVIPKTGDAGTVSTYTSVGTNTTINDSSPDACQTSSAVTVSNGTTNKSWTKIVRLTGSSPKVTLGSSWKWLGGTAPALKQNGFLVLGWCGSGGLAVFNAVS